MAASRHLASHEDLITPHAATRAGFIALALERNREADPFVQEARALKVLAKKAKRPKDLLDLHDLRASLLTAAGVSDKAGRYLQQDDQVKAIEGLIENFLEPAGDDFIEELLYRFLLTKGDALGGRLRNLAGRVGERKFTRSLIATLSVNGLNPDYLAADTGEWLQYAPGPGVESRIKGLHWRSVQGDSALIYNLTVPLFGNNVDICLFRCGKEAIRLKGDRDSAHFVPSRYLALGEIKGGIDPAGADEHWKTARTALERIRAGFAAEGCEPRTFFVGAAIATAMAQEIYQQLTDGTLSQAANLTNDEQLVSLCEWLIRL